MGQLDPASFNQVGDLNLLGRENLQGTSAKDLFLIDTTPSGIRDSNLVINFSRDQEDMLRFTHDGAAANAKTKTLYTWFEGEHLIISGSMKDPEGDLVTLRSVGASFELQDRDVLEDATISSLASKPTAPQLREFTQLDGATDTTLPNPQVLDGKNDTKDMLLIDTVGANERGAIEVITKFSRTDGNMLHVGEVDADNNNIADIAFNSEKMTLYVRLINRFDNEGEAADDLAVYTEQGNLGSTLAVLRDAGTDFELTNDDVWQDVTIETFIPEVP